MNTCFKELLLQGSVLFHFYFAFCWIAFIEFV